MAATIAAKDGGWDLEQIREDLRQLSLPVKKEAMKRVIGFYTIGQDMSGIFVDVVNCMQTEDVELKKLVYLYIMNYAERNAQLAILAVSSFTRDTNSHNPLLRALAIRTMGCIRVPEIAEYLCEPLRKAIEDEDPYVRKTAAVCVAKLYDITPETVEEQGFIDLLRNMLSDSNPVVVSNAIAAMCEIQENSPKEIMHIDVKMLQRLMTAMDECIEWGQIFILDALVRYKPRTPREAEAIIDRLTPRLQHTNSAIVLSAAKLIMKYMDFLQNDDSVRSVCRKLAPPLVTLLSSEKHEIQYIALRNINLIVQKRPEILVNEVKVFFCKYNDPIYVKMEKLDILVKLARHRTIEQLLTEFKAYATEVDVEVVRRSVRCIGECAIKIDKVAERCIKALLALIESKVHVVVQEAVVVIRDIFRRYPNKYESIIAPLCENLDTLDEPDAKAAMIWIIGEYSDRIENAGDLLETFIDNWEDESSMVQLQILTAVVKLFLMRPSETQQMVTQIIDLVTKESDNPDLRDRGFVYWRLLAQSPQIAKSVIFAERPVIGEGLGSYDPNLLTVLLDNIGTLSGLYHMPPETFVRKPQIHLDREAEMAAQLGSDSDSGSGSGSGSDSSSSESEEEGGSGAGASGAKDLMDLDLMGLGSMMMTSMASEMPEILSAAQGNGLSIRGAFVREEGKTYLSMSMQNNSTVQMSQFAMQFNKNALALKPEQAQFTVVIAPGSQGSYKLPCGVTPPQLKQGGEPTVEIALKTVAGVFKMVAPSPVNSIFTENAVMPPAQLGKLWQSSPDTSAASIIITPKNTSKEAITAVMKSINMYFSTERKVGGLPCYYFSAKTLTNQPFVAELRVNGAKVQSLVKSGNPLLSANLNEMIAKVL